MGSPNFTPRTTDQNKRIHGLANPLGLSKEDLHALAFEISGERTESTSQLSFDEANALIKRLGGEPLPAAHGLSTRSQQRARQKAGVPQIVTDAHYRKLLALWAKEPARTMDGLAAICRRTIKTDSPRTTAECNKVIEAVKDMNRRPRRNATAPIGRAA